MAEKGGRRSLKRALKGVERFKRIHIPLRGVRLRREHVTARMRRWRTAIWQHQNRAMALTLLLVCVFLGYFWQRSPLITYVAGGEAFNPPAMSITELEAAPLGATTEDLLDAQIKSIVGETTVEVLNSGLRLNSARYEKNLRPGSRAFIELNWESLTDVIKYSAWALEVRLSRIVEPGVAAVEYPFFSPIMAYGSDQPPKSRRLRLRSPAPNQQFAEVDLPYDMPKGAYELSIAIVDPMRLIPALRLNNPSPLDARYPLGIVYVK